MSIIRFEFFRYREIHTYTHTYLLLSYNFQLSSCVQIFKSHCGYSQKCLMEWFHILLLKTLPLVELIIVVLILPSSFSFGWVSKNKTALTNQSFPEERRWKYNNYFCLPCTPLSFSPTFMLFQLYYWLEMTILS